MKRKHIDAAREARLWIGQIIVPAVTLGTAVVVARPEIVNTIADKANNIKEAVKTKFAKKEI